MMRGVPVNVFMSGILKALEDGEKAFGISVNSLYSRATPFKRPIRRNPAPHKASQPLLQFPFLQHLHATFDGKSGGIMNRTVKV